MKYRRRSYIVDAVQWFPGIAVPGLAECVPEFVRSADRALYYCVPAGRERERPAYWLGKRMEGPGPKNESGGFKGCAQYSSNTTGAVWHREALPFSFYSIKGEKIKEPADVTSEEWLDYACLHHWESKPPCAYFLNADGSRRIVDPGDWIVNESSTTPPRIVPDADFAQDFEMAGDA